MLPIFDFILHTIKDSTVGICESASQLVQLFLPFHLLRNPDPHKPQPEQVQVQVMLKSTISGSTHSKPEQSSGMPRFEVEGQRENSRVPCTMCCLID